MTKASGNPGVSRKTASMSEADLTGQMSRQTSRGSDLKTLVGATLGALVLVYALLHVGQVLFLWQPPELFRTLHLCLSLVVLSLVGLQATANAARRILCLALVAAALAVLAYVFVMHDALINDRLFGPSSADMLVGVVLLVSVMLAAQGVWGFTIPALAILALLYGYFGHLFSSNLLFHGGMSLERLLSYTSIPYFQGVLGSMTGLSGTMIFIFMLLAGLLKSTGGIDFVLRLAGRISGMSRGGPAKVAIIGSGIMGMISGSTVANVASTGTITIPLMTKTGFSPEEAGAVEAVSSTGGQFMPPVMGLTAFLIVGITGASYSTVMLAAAIPAVVFYVNLILAVHFSAAARESLSSPVAQEVGDLPDWKTDIGQFAHLILAVILLTILLLQQVAPSRSAIIAIGFLAAAEIFKQLYLNRDDLGRGIAIVCRRLYEGVLDGVKSGAQLAAVIAVIGIIVDMMTVTGLAQRLSHMVLGFENLGLFPLLCIVAATCLVFGLGMPTPAAYTLVAVLGAPTLVSYGVDLLAAHMFVFFFAAMSAITPPIALASLIASRISGGNYAATAMHSVRLGLPGFILPFFLVYYPEILLSGDNMFATLLRIGAMLVFFFALNVVFAGSGVWSGSHILLRLLLLAVAAISTVDSFQLPIVLMAALAGAVLFVRQRA